MVKANKQIGFIIFGILAINAPMINFAYAQNNGFSLKNPQKETIALQGESLFDIAERTKTPLIGIIELNALQAPYNLSKGQVLKIPSLKMHIVKSGETLDAIADRYSIDKRSLAVFNNLKKPYLIKTGQKIALPAMVRDQYTGLEPQDLVNLLSNEIEKGASVSGKGKTPIIIKPKPITPIKPPNKTGEIVKPKKPQIEIKSSGKFAWPLRGKLVETFGEKQGFRTSDGIDIEAKEDTPFFATDDGKVVYSGNQLEGYGWLILIRHSNDYISAYAYGSQILVAEDDFVKKGQIIGKVGATGRAKTPRLHFQIRKGSSPQDPLKYLPKI